MRGVFLHKVIHNFCESSPTPHRPFPTARGVHDNRPLLFRTRIARRTFPLFSIIQAAGWPIWPLVACSILALALVIERFISLKTAKVAPPKLLDEALAVSRVVGTAPDVVTQLAQQLGARRGAGQRLPRAQLGSALHRGRPARQPWNTPAAPSRTGWSAT